MQFEAFLKLFTHCKNGNKENVCLSVSVEAPQLTVVPFQNHVGFVEKTDCNHSILGFEAREAAFVIRGQTNLKFVL